MGHEIRMRMGVKRRGGLTDVEEVSGGVHGLESQSKPRIIMLELVAFKLEE